MEGYWMCGAFQVYYNLPFIQFSGVTWDHLPFFYVNVTFPPLTYTDPGLVKRSGVTIFKRE